MTFSNYTECYSVTIKWLTCSFGENTWNQSKMCYKNNEQWDTNYNNKCKSAYKVHSRESVAKINYFFLSSSFASLYCIFL